MAVYRYRVVAVGLRGAGGEAGRAGTNRLGHASPRRCLYACMAGMARVRACTPPGNATHVDHHG